jgi:hypothetical protein
MEKETIKIIKDETNLLLAQRALQNFDSFKLIEWAISLMTKGIESESLIILAGLDSESTQEREKYFWKAIEELELNTKKSDSELIRDYAIYIAESVINKKITPSDGLTIMQDIVFSADYSYRYIQFYELKEDFDYLNHDNSTVYNSGLTLKNADRFITKEFELFLKAEKFNIDDEVRNLAYCNTCGQIAKPRLKPKRNLIGKVKYKFFVCGLCKSEDILAFSNQKGKEIIINRINAT